MSKKSCVIFVAFVGILIIGEFIARYGLGLGEPPISIPDEHIDYLFAPNQVCHRFGNVIRYNNKSMRCDFDIVEPCKKGGVIVIGDSVINGGALTDHEKLATTILQRKYKGVPFYNVSAGSWGPGNYAAYLRKYGIFGADYLVVEMNSHDIWEDNPELTKGAGVGVDISEPAKRPICALWEGFDRYFMPMARKWLGLTDNRINKVDMARWDNASEDREEYNFNQLNYIFSLNICHKCLLIWRSRNETIKCAASDGEMKIKIWAKQHGVEVITVKTDESCYRDKIHPNTEGQKRIAQCIDDWMNCRRR